VIELLASAKRHTSACCFAIPCKQRVALSVAQFATALEQAARTQQPQFCFIQDRTARGTRCFEFHSAAAPHYLRLERAMNASKQEHAVESADTSLMQVDPAAESSESSRDEGVAAAGADVAMETNTAALHIAGQVPHGLGAAADWQVVPDAAKSKHSKDALFMKHQVARQAKCTACGVDIGSVCYLRCSVCTNVVLCLACYSVGSIAFTHKHPQHKSNHPYRVSQKYNFPIFRPDWTASDELMLINGLMHYGVGNWSGISSQVRTSCLESSLFSRYHHVSVLHFTHIWLPVALKLNLLCLHVVFCRCSEAARHLQSYAGTT
jgi:hypothetical protein